MSSVREELTAACPRCGGVGHLATVDIQYCYICGGTGRVASHVALSYRPELIPGETSEPLNLLDKTEWRDVSRKFVKLTDAEFDELWVRFCQEKVRRAQQ